MQTPVLNPLVNLANQVSAVNTINANNTILTTAIGNTLDRYGSAPNQMQNNLDMNNNQILNLPSPASINSPARLIDVVSNPSVALTVPPVGTSGAVVGLLNGNNTYSGTSTFTGAVTLPNPSTITTLDTSSIVFAGSTSGTTTLQATAIAGSGTLSLPTTATDTLAGAASTTTFTNKTYDTAGTGNVFKINGVTINSNTGTGANVLATSPTLVTPALGAATATSVTATGAIAASGANSTVGYVNGSGAGSTVTQLTSKSTAVTLNAIAGQITMQGASLGAATGVSFVLTNSFIAATDVVIVNIATGSTGASSTDYNISISKVAAGSCTISLYNQAGSKSDSLVLNFVVIKGANS
jgi:hypothetical protein